MNGKNLDHLKRLLAAVGMHYKEMQHDISKDAGEYHYVRVYRNSGGLEGNGSGETLAEAIDRAMTDQHIDWHSLSRRLSEEEWWKMSHV